MKKLNNYIKEALVKKHIPVKKIPNGYVDLGLPSGTLWATEDYQVGEKTEILGRHAQEIWREFDKSNSKYNLPSCKQFDELYENCELTKYGDNIVFTSKKNSQEVTFASRGYWTKTTDLDLNPYYSDIKIDKYPDQYIQPHGYNYALRIRLVINQK